MALLREVVQQIHGGGEEGGEEGGKELVKEVTAYFPGA